MSKQNERLGYRLERQTLTISSFSSALPTLSFALDASELIQKSSLETQDHACRAGYRSEAVYVRSEDATVSNGAGYVQTLAIAATFGKSRLP